MSDALRQLTVSVCTPTYQGADRLRRTAPLMLDSLGPDDEWMVSIDGSVDGTLEYVTDLSREDTRVRPLMSSVNRGRTAALNAACATASNDVVLRVDDDILVKSDFVDLHRSAHAEATHPVGLVSPITDVAVDPNGDDAWRRFVERNATADQRRFSEHPRGLPAVTWGGACSVLRHVGAGLDWYDTRFSQYGWEDVEFGYRLLQSGVPIKREPLAGVEHVTHNDCFVAKFRRGFPAGARMAVFAAIHGPDAVLHALGVDPEARQAPSYGPHRLSRRRDDVGLRAAAALVAGRGERLLSAAGYRRAYDWWVARWLTWSYSTGWAEESARMGLPVIPSPSEWKTSARRSQAETWADIVAAIEGQEARGLDAGVGWSVARSAMLRAMEQPSISHVRAWRAAAAAVKHARRAAPHRQGLAASPKPADVVAVLDAPTPSNVGTLGSLLDAAAEAGLSCHVVCSTKEERAALLRVKPAAEASLLDDWSVPADRPARQRGAAWRDVPVAIGSVKPLTRVAGLHPPARLQLIGEAVQTLRAREPLEEALKMLDPKVVVAASEYFMVTCAALDAAHRLGTPFVTMQHGAVNILYAPFRADQYWVWTDDDAEALRTLQPERAASVRSIRRETAGEQVPLPSRADARRDFDLPAAGRCVLVYSQTHGAEFSGATHFSIAAQLAEVLQARSDAYLLVKRHPSEERSAYESLRRRFGADRVLVAPPGASAASCARAADVACAISSTALRDAAAAGCPAIEVLSPESLVRHPVAASRVEPEELAAALLEALQEKPVAHEVSLAPLTQPSGDGAPTLAEALRALCAGEADA